MMIVAASLLLGTFRTLWTASPGFARENVLLVNVDLPDEIGVGHVHAGVDDGDHDLRGTAGDLPRLFIHESDHQHLAGLVILHDRGDEAKGRRERVEPPVRLRG